MRHRIEAGRDAYVVVVADAPDGRGDLWAVHAGGGEAVQLTFSLPAESGPRLSPHGDVVAFLRARNAADTVHRRVWLLNLLSGAERELVLPEEAGVPLAVAWGPEGRVLVIRTTAALWLVNAPPAQPDPQRLVGADVVRADSAFGVFVGSPPFARVVPCDGAPGICSVDASGQAAVISPEGREPVAWGPDSVAWLEGDEIVVRPAGPGRARRAKLPARLDNVREGTAFLGRSAAEAADPEGLRPGG
ncbi:MAG TPA: hypothetical protein VFX50_11885 [Gemmatimonadales bacterium]|nr:hypothetical protein [Gemmatimonadales bacterium]